jgi:hypothetical protein
LVRSQSKFLPNFGYDSFEKRRGDSSELGGIGSFNRRDLRGSDDAGLDIRKPGIKVLFAGSSEAALREMFSRAAAPFYNWAPVEPFPLLGHEFVAATVKQLATVA